MAGKPHQQQLEQTEAQELVLRLGAPEEAGVHDGVPERHQLGIRLGAVSRGVVDEVEHSRPHTVHPGVGTHGIQQSSLESLEFGVSQHSAHRGRQRGSLVMVMVMVMVVIMVMVMVGVIVIVMIKMVMIMMVIVMWMVIVMLMLTSVAPHREQPIARDNSSQDHRLTSLLQEGSGKMLATTRNTFNVGMSL
jgi:ABC-type multidrug transport system fused ATPase/permease subunit